MPRGVYPRRPCPPLADRFWPKVNKDGPPPPHLPELGPCWLWTAGSSDDGYGNIKQGRKRLLAHRVSWDIHNGPIPAGLFVCHRCDTPPCVRPEHLFVGTNADNIKDAYAKGRAPSGEHHYTRATPEKALRGEAHGRAKLTADNVRVIRTLFDTETDTEIGKRFGVSGAAIFLIRTDRNWRHVE